MAVTLVILSLGSLADSAFAAGDPKAEELANALGQVKIFAGLTDAERAALKSVATLRHCKKGDRIIEQGKPLTSMFVVLEGQAEVKANGKVVATLPEQSLVGEIEFLDGLPASADVIVLKDTLLIELNSAGLKALMDKQPHLGYELMTQFAKLDAQRLRDQTPRP